MGVTDARYEQWARDGEVLAQIGRAVFGQPTLVSVRVPLALAEEALAAWQRDTDDEPLSSETPEQSHIRHRAAVLGLIGLSIESSGVVVAHEIVVEIDAWQIGDALRAANDDDLLKDA
jgi:hypothetical protein